MMGDGRKWICGEEQVGECGKKENDLAVDVVWSRMRLCMGRL